MREQEVIRAILDCMRDRLHLPFRDVRGVREQSRNYFPPLWGREDEQTMIKSIQLCVWIYTASYNEHDL